MDRATEESVALFYGSTSNEVRGARQPTSVVLKLGAPNQCSVVPLGRARLLPSRTSVFSAQCSVLSFQCSVFSVQSSQSPPPLGRMLLPSRGNQWHAGVFGSPRASPSHDRSQHLGLCSLQLRTGFRVDPIKMPALPADSRSGGSSGNRHLPQDATVVIVRMQSGCGSVAGDSARPLQSPSASLTQH